MSKTFFLRRCLRQAETISTNMPKTLEFYVPEDLSPAQYSIVLRTRYSSGEKELKNLSSAASKTVTVTA